MPDFKSYSPATQARVKRFVDWFIRDESACPAFDLDWINEPARSERCYDAAANGSDGSTHQERIEDFRRNFGNWIADYRGRASSHGAFGHDRFRDAVDRYFDDLEAWHDQNGSLRESAA